MLLVPHLRRLGQRGARIGQAARQEAAVGPRRRRPEPERHPEQLGQRQIRELELEPGGRLAR
eukprot:5951753-Lingulodinium_polyedra.AAC.1